jgi:hypothetical protein
MSKLCDNYAEQLISREINDELTSHVETCARCQSARSADAALQQAGVQGQLRAASNDPGAGFAARIAVGAQRRLGVRRRNRIVAVSAGSATTLAAVAVLFVSMRHNGATLEQPAISTPSKPTPTPIAEQPSLVDEDRDNSKALVRWQATADAWQQNRRPSLVKWHRIMEPIAAYQTVFIHHKSK